MSAAPPDGSGGGPSKLAASAPAPESESVSSAAGAGATLQQVQHVAVEAAQHPSPVHHQSAAMRGAFMPGYGMPPHVTMGRTFAGAPPGYPAYYPMGYGGHPGMAPGAYYPAYAPMDPRAYAAAAHAAAQAQSVGGHPVPPHQWRPVAMPRPGPAMDPALLSAVAMSATAGNPAAAAAHHAAAAQAQAQAAQPPPRIHPQYGINVVAPPSQQKPRGPPPAPVELYPLSQSDLTILRGAPDPATMPPVGCVGIQHAKQTGMAAVRCSKAFGVANFTRWCEACRRAFESKRSAPLADETDDEIEEETVVVASPSKRLKAVSAEEAADSRDEDTEGAEDGYGSGSAAAADTDSGKLLPGRRRKHVCTDACNHICATEGCFETLTAAAARSRYIRCAKCRRNGIKSLTVKRLQNDTADVDSGGNEADHEIEEVISRRKKAKGKGKGPRTEIAATQAAAARAAQSRAHVRPKATSPELTVSQKGRVRMPAKIYSPSHSPMVAVPPNRFSFDVDQDSTLLETPKRTKRELQKGSPRLGGMWSPRSIDSPTLEDDESVYSERLEPRIYISPAPNWFVRPPVGADPSLVARLISAYRADMLARKRAAAIEARKVFEEEAPQAGPAADSLEAAPDSKPVTSTPLPLKSRKSASPAAKEDTGAAADAPQAADMEVESINLGNDEPSTWLPSSKTSAAVSPIQVGRAASLDDDEPERSASVTIGLPDGEEEVVEDNEEDRSGSHDSDVPAQLRLAVESTASEGTGTFDPAKCRKCQISDENDMEDLIVCSVCSMAFHAGCEEPPMDWTPSEAFCSIICFENFKVSAAGIELFKMNMMLTKGHLREYVNCFNNETVDEAVTQSAVDPPFPAGELMQIQSAEWLRPGQCISLRAEPHVDDPRTEWPAVVRHVFHHRSGNPLFYVTWLDPIRPDKSYYHEMPGGIAQLAPCPSVTCPTRRGYGNFHGYQCYSATCRQRNADNGYSADRHSPFLSESEGNSSGRAMRSIDPAPSPAPAAPPIKVPSRLRIAMSASELAASSSEMAHVAQAASAAQVVKQESVEEEERKVVEASVKVKTEASPDLEVVVPVQPSSPNPLAPEPLTAVPMAAEVPDRDDPAATVTTSEVAASDVPAKFTTEEPAKETKSSTGLPADDSMDIVPSVAPTNGLAAMVKPAEKIGQRNGQSPPVVFATSPATAAATAVAAVASAPAVATQGGPQKSTRLPSDDAVVQSAGSAWTASRASPTVNVASSQPIVAASADPVPRVAAEGTAMEVESAGSAPESRSRSPPPRSPPIQRGGFEAPADLTLPYRMQPGTFTLPEGSDSRASADSDVTVTGDEMATDDTVSETDTNPETDRDFWSRPPESLRREVLRMDEAGYDSATSAVSAASSAMTARSDGASAASGKTTAEGAAPATPRPRKRKRNTKPETNLTKAEMEAKYGKRAIMCTCGRVFANGQALGGHRGKCKVPRERAKALAAGVKVDSDSDAEVVRAAKKARTKPKVAKPTKPDKAERERQKAEAKEKKAREKAAAKAAAREEKLREKMAAKLQRKVAAEKVAAAAAAGAAAKPSKSSSRRRGLPPVIAAVRPNIKPVYPLRPFHPDNYRLGRNERRPQVPAAVVKIHPFIFPDLPVNFFTMHRDFARHKHSMAKIDELNPNTDAQLYGPVDEPELDPNQGFLEFGREAPRKLAFVAPGIKMRDDAKLHLGRTRSQTPNSDTGSIAGDRN
mmetsp:Transcript_31503/g.94640  ORF Transcript_31503/g.94640 Transcript_31503/m.94640 type:complete len:1713 (-) Transcript_31503:384-5522(-)